MQAKAVFSECRKYRYYLSRTWESQKASLVFIGMNPSTADEELDDRTTIKCITYAKSWGYGELIMLNLNAFVSSNPKELFNCKKPEGKDNWYWLVKTLAVHEKVILMWGNCPISVEKFSRLMDLIKQPLCFKQNKNGMPTHPLYLPLNLKPKAFQIG